VRPGRLRLILYPPQPPSQPPAQVDLQVNPRTGAWEVPCTLSRAELRSTEPSDDMLRRMRAVQDRQEAEQAAMDQYYPRSLYRRQFPTNHDEIIGIFAMMRPHYPVRPRPSQPAGALYVAGKRAYRRRCGLAGASLRLAYRAGPPSDILLCAPGP
jgi:hypothetical protein